MSHAKHTPGPWRAVACDTGWLIESGDGLGANHIADEHGHVGPAADDDRDGANADLIAAAPDLLAACEALYDLTPWSSADQRLRAEEQARVAIAKARKVAP